MDTLQEIEVQDLESTNINNKDLSSSTALVVAGENSLESHTMSSADKVKLIELYPALGESSILKVIEATNCLIEIYHLFGLKRITKNSSHNDWIRYENQIRKSNQRCLEYMSAYGRDMWIPYFKYKTCAFYAHYENQAKIKNMPSQPEGLKDKNPGFLFGGYIRNFQKLLEKKDNALFQSFILSINMAKMGMPRAEKHMIEQAELKCATHLTTPPPCVNLCIECGMPNNSHHHIMNCIDRNDYFLGMESHPKLRGNPVYLTKEKLIDECKRTVRELFNKSVYTEDDHYEPFFPSTSANYNRSRSKGGAVGEISNLIDKTLVFLRNPTEPYVKINKVRGIAQGEITKKYGKIGEIEQQELDENPEEKEIDCIEYDEKHLKTQWRILFDEIGKQAFTEEPKVEPVGLAEALKIRVISKGPPKTYTYLAPLQKFMWRTLKNNKVFKLISTPLTEEHIQERLGIPTPAEIIINGDYKASTDNLHRWISEAIAYELIDILNRNHDLAKLADPDSKPFFFTEDHKKLFITSLTQHKFRVGYDLVYNENTKMNDKIGGEWLPQMEGQLMGSVTSFPILCIANAAMCRLALETSYEDYEQRKVFRLSNYNDFYDCKNELAPLLINGDDCTLKGGRTRLRDNWEKITSFGGLTSSIGKTMFSLPDKPLAVLNSQTYHVIEGKWKEIKFINMGILLGKARSSLSSKQEKGEYHEMGALHHELFLSSPESIWPEVSKQFIYFNKETLDLCPAIPWDTPNYLGGPQLEVREGGRSLLDRNCATLIIKEKEKNKRFKIEQPKKNTFWKVHEYTMEVLREYEVPDCFQQVRPIIEIENINIFDEEAFHFYDTEDESAKLYKYLCIQEFLTRPVEALFNEYYTPNIGWMKGKTNKQVSEILSDKIKMAQMPSIFGRKKVEEKKKGKKKKKECNRVDYMNKQARQKNNIVWMNATKEAFKHNLDTRTDDEINYLKKFNAYAVIPQLLQ